MVDITACSGQDEVGNFVCPLKDNCYRFTCVKNQYRQAYFTEIPFDKDKADCKYFSPNNNNVDL